MRTRRVVLSAALAITLGVLAASPADATSGSAVLRNGSSARPARPVTRACALLTGPEIASVLGAAPGRGRRDRSYCRYEPLPDQTSLITALFRGTGTEAIAGARRIAVSLGGTVEDVAGLGAAALWEPDKGQLSVATRRGNAFEVQIIRAAGDPAVTRQQAIDLARVVLARRRA